MGARSIILSNESKMWLRFWIHQRSTISKDIWIIIGKKEKEMCCMSLYQWPNMPAALCCPGEDQAWGAVRTPSSDQSAEPQVEQLRPLLLLLLPRLLPPLPVSPDRLRRGQPAAFLLQQDRHGGDLPPGWADPVDKVLQHHYVLLVWWDRPLAHHHTGWAQPAQGGKLMSQILYNL